MEEIFIENLKVPYGNKREGNMYSMRDILKGCVKSKGYILFVLDTLQIIPFVHKIRLSI